jgi:hypothetical protein
MKQLFRFLGLAAGLAFAAGMVLAGLALLLAMPAFANGLTPANRDFELSWTPRAAQLQQVAWFTEKKDGRHYALLMVLPPAAALAERLPREVIFVLDTSGSMASCRRARPTAASPCSAAGSRS